MARLIEAPPAGSLPPPFSMRVGDVLLCNATGGHVLAGADAIEMLGAFVPATLADSGEVLSAMGAPGTVLFRARSPGRATIDVVTGDPFGATQATRLEVIVED